MFQKMISCIITDTTDTCKKKYTMQADLLYHMHAILLSVSFITCQCVHVCAVTYTLLSCATAIY